MEGTGGRFNDKYRINVGTSEKEHILMHMVLTWAKSNQPDYTYNDNDRN